MPVWIQAKPGTGPGERSRVNDPCGVKGQRPFVNSPRQQPVKDSSTTRSGAGARETCRMPARSASIQQKRERLRRSLFLLCPVSGVVDAKLKHGNHKRVTAISSLCVLGKAVRLVQSVTIPAPVKIIALLRVFAFPLDGLNFLRYQTADFFLTFCHDFHPLFIHFLPRTAHTRKRKPPQPAPPAWLPLLCSDSPAVGAGCPGTPPAQRPPRCCG